jgi:hypothetical protein
MIWQSAASSCFCSLVVPTSYSFIFQTFGLIKVISLASHFDAAGATMYKPAIKAIAGGRLSRR